MSKIYFNIYYKILILLLLFIYNLSISNAQIIAPNFTLTDTHGNSFNLYQELDAGKIIVLDFFTISCGSCANVVPVIEQVWQNAGADCTNLWVWGIESFNGTTSAIDSFIHINGGTYPGFSTSGNETLLSLYEVTYTPRYFVINHDHKMKIVTVENVQETVNSYLSTIPAIGGNFGTSKIISIIPGNPITINYFTKNSCNATFEIYDLLGNLKYRYSVIATRGGHGISIGSQQLSPGYYFIRMLENNNLASLKKFAIY